MDEARDGHGAQRGVESGGSRGEDLVRSGSLWWAFEVFLKQYSKLGLKSSLESGHSVRQGESSGCLCLDELCHCG